MSYTEWYTMSFSIHFAPTLVHGIAQRIGCRTHTQSFEETLQAGSLPSMRNTVMLFE